jgi:hypothetical protein
MFTSPKRLGRLLLILLVVGVVFLALTHRVFRRDTFVRQAVSRIRPGMEHSEVQALLKPFRADHIITEKGKAGGTYFFRGIDEWVGVVMDGTGEEARVVDVKRSPDGGPWWERTRRNWEWRLR